MTFAVGCGFGGLQLGAEEGLGMHEPQMVLGGAGNAEIFRPMNFVMCGCAYVCVAREVHIFFGGFGDAVAGEFWRIVDRHEVKSVAGVLLHAH